MSEEPRCRYCGCCVPEALVRDPMSGLCFCNGRGNTKDSHAVHFLKRTGRTKVEFLQGTPMEKVSLECKVCGSCDVFRLGTVSMGSEQCFVCRSPCLFENFKQAKDTFTPLIVNGAFRDDFVKVPQPSEFKKINTTKAAKICREIKQGKEAPKQPEKREVKPAQLTYESYTEYEEVMKQFVQLEREMDMITANKTQFSGVKIEWDTVDGRALGKFRAPIRLFKGVSVGGSIRLKAGSQLVHLPVLAKKMKGLVVTVSCAPDKLEMVKSAKDGKIGMDVNDLVYQRQFNGLQAFGNLQQVGMEVKEIPIFNKDIAYTHIAIRSAFLGNMTEFAKRNMVRRNPLQLVLPECAEFPPLNNSQRMACENAMKKHVSLIQGPPGTGKTTVIAALAHSFVKQGHKVLVVAHTNIAVDNATMKIALAGLKPLRVFGATSEETPEMAEFSTRKFVTSDKTEFEDECHAIKEADVVLTTTGCIGGKRFRGIPFPKVIVDEAGQCPDPDIIPAVMRNCDQLILVGDHKQLGPFAQSALSKKGSYTMSLMLRLVALKQIPDLLMQQYRMHPAIAHFSSWEFYHGMIRSGIKPEDRIWKHPTINWPDNASPVMFWNTKGEEQITDGGTSYCNIDECRAIAKLLAIFEQSGVAGSSIGVISPYIGQVNLLNDGLQEMSNTSDDFFTNLEIDTVDAFQGREKDFIIFSCVRGNNEHKIGFLSDLTRMNVALTRAKFGLIVVGTASVFEKNESWAKFIEYCQKLNVLVEGEVNAWVPSTFTRFVEPPSPEAEVEEDSDEELDFI